MEGRAGAWNSCGHGDTAGWAAGLEGGLAGDCGVSCRWVALAAAGRAEMYLEYTYCLVWLPLSTGHSSLFTLSLPLCFALCSLLFAGAGDTAAVGSCFQPDYSRAALSTPLRHHSTIPFLLKCAPPPQYPIPNTYTYFPPPAPFPPARHHTSNERVHAHPEASLELTVSSVHSKIYVVIINNPPWVLAFPLSTKPTLSLSTRERCCLLLDLRSTGIVTNPPAS